MTAHRFLLTASFLSCCINGDADFAADKLSLMYCESAKKATGTEFNDPSLSYLIKFWQDPIEDVSTCARNLLSLTLKTMSSTMKKDLMQYFQSTCKAK
jgi:hypothetical protein